MERLERLPARRRAAIIERLRAEGAASIQQLADDVGASASTIRRDLGSLMKQGYLERTHGGAVLQGSLQATFEPDAATAAALWAPQKRAIGREAARRIKPGNSVILDASSTVLEAARFLVENPMPLTLVTNGLMIATLFAESPNLRVLVLGGTLRPHSAVILGEPGESFLGRLHVDLCLLGTHALTGTTLSETTLEGAALKRAMIRAARRTIVLADSSKLQSPAFSTICDLSEVSELITDEGIDPAELSALRAAGMIVSVVSAPAAAPRPGGVARPAAAPRPGGKAAAASR